jgi:hypothetical protein
MDANKWVSSFPLITHNNPNTQQSFGNRHQAHIYPVAKYLKIFGKNLQATPIV